MMSAAAPPTGVSLSFMLGVAMAIAGNSLIACSLTLQKYVHNQRRGKPAGHSTLFWLALIGMIAGEVGNFAAFGFASPTVVSPLGAVAVIANAILAVLFLKEAIFCHTLIGIVCTVCGSVVVVYFSPPSVDHLSVDEFVGYLCEPPAIAYLATVGSSVLALVLLEPWIGHRYLLVNLLICSLLGSVTVLCSSATSKFISQALSGGAHTVLNSPVPYCILPILASTAVLQLRYLNKAMEHFDSTQVVPTYYITFTLASISGGGVVLRDFWRLTPDRALGFGLGALLCFGGVALITRKPTGSRPLGAHATESAEATLSPSERLRRAVRRVNHAQRFAQLVSSRLDLTLLGGEEGAANAANAVLDPPIAASTGMGTLMHLHRVSMGAGVWPGDHRASVSTRAATVTPTDLAAGLLANAPVNADPALPLEREPRRV